MIVNNDVKDDWVTHTAYTPKIKEAIVQIYKTNPEEMAKTVEGFSVGGWPGE